jgi:5-methylcytosine-specific restriction protein A
VKRYNGKSTLYNYAWQKYRKQFLADNEWCVMHLKRGMRVKANIVDHKTPHRGDMELFWNPDNHQALCKFCHDSIKQRYEKSKTIAGCDTTGRPLDPNHHWNR